LSSIRASTTKLPCLGDFICSQPRTAYNGSMSQPAAPGLTRIIKEVFLGPAVAMIAAFSTLSTFLVLIRSTILANVNLRWNVVRWILSWHWQTWIAL
jgi:hypothetical protein